MMQVFFRVLGSWLGHWSTASEAPDDENMSCTAWIIATNRGTGSALRVKSGKAHAGGGR